MYGGSEWGILREPTTFPTPPHCWQHWIPYEDYSDDAVEFCTAGGSR